MDLEEERIKQKNASRTLSQTIGLYSLRAFLSLVVLAMIVGAFFGIAFATQYSQVKLCVRVHVYNNIYDKVIT